MLVEKLGYVQSKGVSCVFFLFDKDHNLIGNLGLATDDILHGGGKEHQQKMEWLRSTYKLGKFQFVSGRFAGKDIKLEGDGSITVQQCFYVEERIHPIKLARNRSSQRYSRCTPAKEEELRGLTGALAWLAKETRADVNGKVSLLQQAFPRPKIKHLLAANKIAKEVIDTKEIGIKIMAIPISNLRVGIVTDAAWGNALELPEDPSAKRSF